MVRPSRAVELAEHLDHLVALGRPQARHHLVEQQQARPRGERARHLEPLAVRQRERGGGLAALRAEPELLEDRGRGAPRRRHARRPLERPDDHVVEHAQARRTACTIWNVRPMPAAHTWSGRRPSIRRPAKRISPTSGAKTPGDHVEDGRLAGAVRPDQPDDGAFGDVERHAGDRAQAAEGLGDVADLEERHGPQSRFARPSFRASVGQMPCGRNITTARSTTP